jgi:HPt (histidine-containing phosphotransfer) domain-containing protein
VNASYLAFWDSLKSQQFDPLALWQRVGEDMQLLREVVRVFASEYPDTLRTIEEAVQMRDAARLQNAGHVLKGSLLQLSAFTAAGTAAELEERAANGHLESAGSLIGKIRTEIDVLMQLLKTMTASAQLNAGMAPEP